MRGSFRPMGLAYGAALPALALGFIVRWQLGSVLGERALYSTYFPAVMIAAYFGGFWPGVLVTIVAALATNFSFADPRFTLQPKGVGDSLALALFVLTGAIISGLSESLHRARRRILVDERRRADEVLRETEERFRQLAENIHEIFWMTDPRHEHVHYISPAYEEVWGQTCQSLYEQPRSWIESIHADDRAGAIENLKQRSRGIFADLEFRILRSDGSLRWIRNRAFPIHCPDGKLSRIAGLAEDITERKRAEVEIRQAKERLELAVRGSRLAIWEFDLPDGQIENSLVTFVNIWELLGYDPVDLPTEFTPAFTLALHAEDQGRVRAEVQACLEGKNGEFESEYRVQHKDGSVRWHLTRGIALRDPQGLPVRFIGSSVDITDLMLAEAALRESEERFRGTFENAAVGIAHCDLEGRYLRVNQKYCEIVGYSRDELLSRTFQELTHREDLGASVDLFLPLKRGELSSYLQEKRLIHKDGSPVWINLSVSLQGDTKGAPVHTIGIVQNISERKRLEEELRQAKETAERANRAKDEFLANVSHEIRTPMNAILGMTELALDTSLTEDQRQCLKTVKSAADNLLVVINDLLDFSKIEAGKLELDSADFSLRTALGDALRALAIRATKKGLELVNYVQPEVPDALIGDAGRLRQVLLNLIGNALKFTDEGEVVVRVETTVEPMSGEEVELRFVVSDTGIGIPADQQDRIFRAFEQEDTSTTRKYGGTGLGLSIAARLVALMGGTITVDSTPGRGSTFAFTARFGRQPHPAEATAALPPILLRDLRVLVVDDNATNRHILAEWLRGWRMVPAAVGDGLAALSALWHAVSLGRPYALVLLDARMPETDGLALAATIREYDQLSATPVILLTSGDRPGDLARSRELRIDAHLLKPVQQEELLETIYRVMGRNADDAPAPARASVPAEAPSATPLRVLVAEDNEFNAKLLEHLLVRRGHQVRLASNGQEALSLAEAEVIDLLLLDVHMPELDGLQVIQAIREREQSAGGHLPVIALTARSRQEDRERCLAAGMDDFLAKPIQAADLWVAIDRVVGKRPPADSPAAGLLDPCVLLAACGGDAAILEKICQAFHAGLPDQLRAVQDALRARDSRRLREAAHKLCGMIAAFSTRSAAVVSQLEDQAADGRLDECEPLVEQLVAFAQELTRQVNDLSIEDLRPATGVHPDC